jgi:hypothetical protein
MRNVDNGFLPHFAKLGDEEHIAAKSVLKKRRVWPPKCEQMMRRLLGAAFFIAMLV